MNNNLKLVINNIKNKKLEEKAPTYIILLEKLSISLGNKKNKEKIYPSFIKYFPTFIC